MSYGVALRNGVPFTLGTIAALCTNATGSAWSPLALWPDGIDTPGMWISPRDLTSQWQDYTGTTPVATPGTVADSANPVGLALDIRAGATVLTDPGNHMLQATSTARPLLSARVNLLQYTEDFSNAWWWVENQTATPNTALAPDGTFTANTLIPTGSGFIVHRTYKNVPGTIGNGVSSVYMKAKEYQYGWVSIVRSNGALYKGAVIDLSDGSVVSNNALSVAVESAGNGWWRISVHDYAEDIEFFISFGAVSSASDPVGSFGPVFAADGTSGIYAWGAQLEYGSEVSPYQPILTDGSTYPSTGFPTYQKYDGTDDGMATATFAAGTMINGMDCMIAVRRDSAAATYLISDTASRGFFEWESGDTGRPDVSAGMPTYYVDGVAVTATKGALFTALTAGNWHILEARGLDLSTWTKVEVSSLVSYRLNGPRGDIMLYPSTASTKDKDAARQYLADYYGVTLP